ncbi:MAG: hypothetical protein EPN91_00830 [Salinibacterium sp.]|nr:MAG: hypothetical protein EPN91_00830 [Salinibacterium sp.]
MVEYSTNLKDLSKDLRRLAERDQEAAIRAARRTAFLDAHRCVQWSLRQIDKTQRPFDTGDYARAWAAEKTPEGAIFYSTASPAVKAGVIELGRRPGTGIPLDPLARWVKRRLGIHDESKARSIAFLISRKAKARGRRGLFILKRAHPKIAAAFAENLRRELHRASLEGR